MMSQVLSWIRKNVRQAKMEEIEYVRKMGLYTKVPIKDCIAKTGKQPIATRWIDVNKQDTINPLYRSRLVGKEFNTYNDLSLYAATPPIEALRLILHLAATNYQTANYKIMTNDVSRAFFMLLFRKVSTFMCNYPPRTCCLARRICVVG